MQTPGCGWRIAVLLMVLCGPMLAQEQEWSLRDPSGWRPRTLPLGPLMQIRVDGRNIILSAGAGTASPGAAPAGGAGPVEKIYRAESKGRPISVEREMRMDPERHAVCVVDVLTNQEKEDRAVRVEYVTSMSDRSGVRFNGTMNQEGESREYGNGLADGTMAAIIFAERPNSTGLPLFVWGPADAPWPASVQDVSSTLMLSYEGTIPGGGKVALVHWVAAAGLDKNIKLEKTFDLFWKDGRLVNPLVSAAVTPLVVNFPAEALKAADPALAKAEAAGKLVDLEALCGKLEITRGAKDILWMGKEEQFEGTVTGEKFSMESGGREVTLPLADVAAVRGGGGRGREHKVYLRDGSILTGKCRLQDAKLAGDLGELTLDADGLELLILHVSAQDGRLPKAAQGFVQLRDGSLLWLDGAKFPAFHLATVFGLLEVRPSELWTVQRKQEPPFNLLTTLADGSRIQGVAQQEMLALPVLGRDTVEVRMSDILRLGSATLMEKEMMPAVEEPEAKTDKPKGEAPADYVWLRDGSLLMGKLGPEALKLRVGTTVAEVNAEEVAKLTLSTDGGGQAVVLLQSGSTVKGTLLPDVLEWRRGTQTLTLPVAWVAEVRQRPSELPLPKSVPAGPDITTPSLILPSPNTTSTEPAPQAAEPMKPGAGTPGATPKDAVPPPGGKTAPQPGAGAGAGTDAGKIAATKAPVNDPLALPPGHAEEDLMSVTPIYPSAASPPASVSNIGHIPNLEAYRPADLFARRTFKAPKGTTRVSAGKPVTTSDRELKDKEGLKCVTDGNRFRPTVPYVQLGAGKQWVQMDLQAPHHLWKIVLWHEVKSQAVYQDVVVQVSNDEAFAKEVTTIFNNDHDNSSGLGEGDDPAYVETSMGRLIDAGGRVARYVRFHSNGNSIDRLNRYIEAAVYGTVEGPVPKPSPAPNLAMPDKPNNPLAVLKRYGDIGEIERLTPAYPKPLYIGRFELAPAEMPHLEMPDAVAVKERLTFRVPPWTANVAERKKVTSSAKPGEGGRLERLVDGDADCTPGAELTLPEGTQWVQVDLGARHFIWKVLLWHDHRQMHVFHDVIVQVSDDATFASGTQTIFNSDHDNSSGLGKGADPTYLETCHGRLIDGCNARGRYVRFYSRGSTISGVNRYAEAMVFGRPTPLVEDPPEAVEPPLSPEERAAREEARVKITVTLSFKYPGRVYTGTEAKVDKEKFPHLEKLDLAADMARQQLPVPAWTTELAARKTVSSSDPGRLQEDLGKLVNGYPSANDVLSLPEGVQWVQVDLEAEQRLWWVLLWHDHSGPVVYQDVVVQVSGDPEFKSGVTTLFNNDHDGSAGLGKGTDPAYIETSLGRLIPARGVLGRYVRLYSNGSSRDAFNRYNEVKIFGAPEPGEISAPLPPLQKESQPVISSASGGATPPAREAPKTPPAARAISPREAQLRARLQAQIDAGTKNAAPAADAKQTKPQPAGSATPAPPP